MQKFNCVSGSSWLDVCLNTYGSLDYFVKMVNDNNITPELPPVSNQPVFWDNTLVENQSTSNTIKAKNIIFATIDFNQNYILTESGSPILTEGGIPLIIE